MRAIGLYALVAATFAAAHATPATAQEDLLQACGRVELRYTPTAPVTGTENVESQFRFLCGQVVGALTAVQPTVGIAFTGGAHTLGTASTIGRRFGLWPRVSITARVNAALAELPALLDDYEPTLDEEGRIPPMGTVDVPVGSLQGDVVVGLFNGFSMAPTLNGLGAVDLLGSVSFIPAFDESGLQDDIVNWGLGARVGVIRQGLITPGVSLSAMYRRMGEVSFGDLDDAASDDPAAFSTDLSTWSLRAGVSQGFLVFDLAAGAGYDIYSSDVFMDWELTCPAGTPPGGCGVETTVRPVDPDTDRSGITGELRTAAWNAFGNIGFNFLIVNVVGEVGYQKATDLVTFDDLRDAGLAGSGQTGDDVADGRWFGSVGVRVSF